jgi:hypothetical protein
MRALENIPRRPPMLMLFPTVSSADSAFQSFSRETPLSCYFVDTSISKRRPSAEFARFSSHGHSRKRSQRECFAPSCSLLAHIIEEAAAVPRVSQLGAWQRHKWEPMVVASHALYGDSSGEKVYPSNMVCEISPSLCHQNNSPKTGLMRETEPMFIKRTG